MSSYNSKAMVFYRLGHLDLHISSIKGKVFKSKSLNMKSPDLCLLVLVGFPTPSAFVVFSLSPLEIHHSDCWHLYVLTFLYSASIFLTPTFSTLMFSWMPFF